MRHGFSLGWVQFVIYVTSFFLRLYRIKFKLTLWLVMKNLAFREGEVSSGLPVYSGCLSCCIGSSVVIKHCARPG